MDVGLRIPVRHGSEIEGELVIPPRAQAIVLFARGTGDGRVGARHRYLPDVLERAGFATLVLDVLTRRQIQDARLTRQHRIDVDMLAERVLRTGEWLAERDETRALALSYFGESTGTAALFMAAARRPQRVKSVLSLAGRPDLSGPALAQVRAPTLLIAGGEDHEGLRLHRHAMSAMRNDPKLEVVPFAGPHFEEKGTLERAAELARAFLLQHGRERFTQRALH